MEKFIKFNGILQVTSLRKFAQFWRKGKTPTKHQVIFMKTTPSDSAYQRTLL
jgi:hypothetical protein